MRTLRLNASGIGRLAAGLLLSLVLTAPRPSAAGGEMPRGDGSQTGDGSTPFTGLAQAPEANLFMGAASTSVTLQVPPGRNGMTPALALTYSSSGGPSPYGYGWDLPIGRIQRSAKFGTPSCTDATHRNDFVVTLPDESIECVLVGSICKPIVEESFAKIVFRNGTGTENVWDVWTRSGVHYVFGEHVASAAGGFSNQPARTGSYLDGAYLQSSATECAYTFSWALTSVEDPNGNRMDFSYLSVDGVLYPASIRYGGNGNRHTAAHPFEVRFEWELRANDGADPAPDYILNAGGGFRSVLTRRLSRVVALYAGSQVRAYDLAYATDRLARQTFLSAVTLFGSHDRALLRDDGEEAESTFFYQQHAPNNGRVGFRAEAFLPPTRNPAKDRLHARDGRNTHRDTFDINGDGFVDLVDSSRLGGDCPSGPGTWDVYLGSRNGFAAAPTTWHVPDGDRLCFVRDGGSCGNDSCTKRDTIDIDGDGIGDYVDANYASNAWQIYFGDPHAGPDGGWGFLPPVTWSMPFSNMRRSGSARFRDKDGIADFVELRDMNGDGLPDLVRAPFSNAGPWQVWYNRGRQRGFETTATPFQAPYNVLAFTEDNGRQRLGTFDMNGDGLPDGVEATPDGFWHVWLNEGSKITASPQRWTMISFGRGGWGIRDVEDDSGDTYRDLLDINGDGLPDIVDSNDDGPSRKWLVLLNRGSGFAPATVEWSGSFGSLRDEDGTYDLIDIDGDGFVDHVTLNPYGWAVIYHNLGGAWMPDPAVSPPPDISLPPGYGAVKENPLGGKPDLLVGIENGIGGSTELFYRPSTQWDNTGGDQVPDLPFVVWTLTRIERDDGMCDDTGTSCVNNNSAHTLVERFSYLGGRFDAAEREFRGFYGVVSEQGDSSVPSRPGTLTLFHQSPALTGRAMASWTFDAGEGGGLFEKPLEASVQTWECANPDTGQTMTCPVPPARTWVRLAASTHYVFSNYSFNQAAVTTTVNEAWATCNGKFYGLVAHSSEGDASGAPRLHTHRDFACIDDGSRYVVDRPIHERLAATDGTTLRERWLFYDAPPGTGSYGTVSKGNLTAVESWLDQSVAPTPNCTVAGGKKCVVHRMAYDELGNVVMTMDPLGRVTLTEYDPATRIYPYVVTNPLQHKIAMTFDPGCGVPLSRSVSYTSGAATSQPAARRAYDEFCRLQRTAYPDEDIAAAPHQRFVYRLGGVGKPTVTFTYTREPNHASGTVLSAVFSDALGRVIQAKREDSVDGFWRLVVTNTAEYDVLGNPVRQYAPFTLSHLPDIERYTSPPSGTGVSQFAYDAAQRVIRATQPDGSRRETDYTVARQTVTKDECYVAANCKGGKVVEKRDAFGRVTETWIYEEPDDLRLRSRNVYDELGQLLMTMQGNPGAPADQWLTTMASQFDYDSLGRKVFHHDPDSGAWEYVYDAGGNLIAQDDPKSGQHLQWCYDALDRVTLKCALPADFDGAASLIQGRCQQTCDASEVRYSYDASSVPNSTGRLTRVTDQNGSTAWLEYDVRGREKVVDKVIDGHLARVRYQYDAADHVTSITYPDGEVVNFAYDAGGKVRRVSSASATYVSSLTYDAFGRPRTVAHGNNVTDTRSYGGPEQNHRIVSFKVDHTSGPRLDYRYASYSPTGMLTTLQDVGPKVHTSADNSATYTYDGVGRLTRAVGAQLGTRTFQYDYLGNIVSMNGQTLRYSALHPHLLERLGSADKNVDHDANGNRTGKPGFSYSYDREDRLIDVNGVQFAYDYAGARVRTIANGVTTRHFKDFFEATSNRYRKYYYAGPLLIASREVVGGWQTAAFLAPSGVELAGSSVLHPHLAFLLGPAAQKVFLLCTALLFVTVLVVPGRRRPVVGIRLRRGHALGLTIVLLFTTMPWPLAVRPAAASGGGSGLPPVYHYHIDHLGSTQLVTDEQGVAIATVRYQPYGEIRGRWRRDGQPATVNDRDRREFTGYETEFNSGLQYSGTRYYDPSLGMFLTHDPRGQYPNPYAYGGWNPVNGTDPDGRFFFLLPMLGPALSALASAATSAATAALTAVQPVLSAVTTLEGLKGIALGALKGAAHGALAGAGRALWDAGYGLVTTGKFDLSGALDAIKDGAISGAISGGFGSVEGIFGVVPANGAFENAQSLASFVGRTAARSALVGLRSAAAAAATGGGPFGKNLLFGAAGGFGDSLAGSFADQIKRMPNLLHDGLSAFAQKASPVFGAPLEFKGGACLPTTFRTVVTGSYEGYVGGVLAGLPAAPREFVAEMVNAREDFSPARALRHALTKRGEANVEKLFQDQGRRLFGRHAPGWVKNLAD